MPLNFMRETPAEFESRIAHEAETLWGMVYSISGEIPGFATPAEREVAQVIADDFIDRGDDSLQPQDYIRQLHQLEATRTGER